MKRIRTHPTKIAATTYVCPQRWQWAILDIVGWIHGSITGSGDTYNSQRLAEWAGWLQWRITEGWELSALERTRAYDEAVRALARTALEEYYAWLPFNRG